MNCDTLEHPRDGSPMVLVPEGPFLMGLSGDDFLAEDHEKPQREVFLSAFWMDVYPVTNARFALFLEAGGYEDPQWWAPEGWDWNDRHGIRRPLQWGLAGWDGLDQPVAGVNWYEAVAYARWAGRRLPTDAEWEKAARGTDARRYPWGNDWPRADLANFNMAVGRTTPVGLYPAGISPYGCLDMAGNVNNWTSDWYWMPYAAFCARLRWSHNPSFDEHMRLQWGHKSVHDKVDRGGGFATPREHQEVLSCTRKLHWRPEAREAWNGFRTAMDVGTSAR